MWVWKCIWKELTKGVCGVSTCGHLIGDITFCTIISKGSQGNSRGFKIVLIKRKHKTTIFLLQIYEKINFQMQLRVRSSKSWSAKQLLKCSCLLSPRETFLLPYVWFGAPSDPPLLTGLLHRYRQDRPFRTWIVETTCQQRICIGNEDAIWRHTVWACLVFKLLFLHFFKKEKIYTSIIICMIFVH